MRFVAEHRVAVFDRFARHMMATAENKVFVAIVAVVVVGYVFWSRNWKPVAATVGAAAIAVVLGNVLKLIIQRPRPPWDSSLIAVNGYAMPSTHAMFTVAAAVALLTSTRGSGSRWWKPAAVAAALAVVGIGVVMVYLGAHWPTDVLVGWPLGILCGFAVVFVIERASTMWDQRRSPSA